MFFSADFETTTDPNDCRVWLWGVVDIYNENNKTHGTDILSFFEWCKVNSGDVYFHNLAFDGSFIIDWLLNNGYVWVKDKPEIGQFTTLISNTGKFYSITVNMAGSLITFKDSMKKLPFSVAEIGKAFDMDISKLSIDYDKPREKGYEPDINEIEYLYHDVLIIARALKIMFETSGKKLTIGADSLADFKKMVTTKIFKRYFPVLSAGLDSEIRQAYRGGFTYANPRFSRRLLGSGKVYDVNSLYPYVMRECLIPYGMPVYYEGAPPVEADLYITSITFTAKLREGFLPCIQVKKSAYFSPTQYQSEIIEPVTMTVTSVDLELWLKHYDINVLSYNGSFVFQGVRGLFNSYIDKWGGIKENETGARRTLAKLHLNSLYGKFATNTDVTGKYPIIDNGVVKLKLGEPETREPVYTPAGVFITAYARFITISAAQQNFDRFIYADTDSIHILGVDEPVGIEIDSKKLGAWKHEGDFTHAVFVRAKQYAETIDGVDHVHIAGLPGFITKSIKVPDLLKSQIFIGKLIPKRVPGGIVLVETTFNFQA